MSSRDIRKTVAQLLRLSRKSTYPAEKSAARLKAVELAIKHRIDLRTVCATECAAPRKEARVDLRYDWLSGDYYDRRTGRTTAPMTR